jgi:DNA-binding MarR family transcriptional regulator
MSSIMRKSVDIVNHRAMATPAETEPSVLELVHAVMHQFRSRQYRALEGTPLDVTHMQSKVLGYYARHAGATQRDLVEHSGRDKAQLARLIKSLRERGLLSAEVDAADRRNVRLRLTEAGREIQRGVRRQARKLEAQAVAGMGSEERERLIASLERVKRNLDRDG